MTEQPLQQPRSIGFCRAIQLTQGLALQTAELTQEQRDLAGLADPTVQLFGEILQWSPDFSGQRQFLQLSDQGGQCGAGLVDTCLPALLGVEHGFFQAREQGGQAGVHVVGAHHFAHFLHALVDGAVGAFRRQGAAYQAAAQQVEACVPATFELFLLFDAFEVFLFPALCFVAHSRDPRGAGLNAGNASAVSEPGRRISTATGR